MRLAVGGRLSSMAPGCISSHSHHQDDAYFNHFPLTLILGKSGINLQISILRGVKALSTLTLLPPPHAKLNG